MERIDAILHAFEEMFPRANIELHHTNGLELLIAVMLSAQSTDASVNKITPALFSKYKTASDYINVPIETLENDLKAIGLYKNKAKNIKATAQAIKERFDGQVPSTQTDLESLPGVGRKTANVVLSVLYNVPRIAVDTHVERVSKRLKLAYNKDSPLKVEEKLMRKFPKSSWSKLHHQMIFFGRYHCLAKKPKCERCPLIHWCRYPNIG